MYLQGLTITMGDVVIVQPNVVVFVECCGKDAHDAFFIVCTICDRIAERPGAVVVRRQAEYEPLWLHNNKVQDVKCWRELANGDLEVLLPLA